MRVSAVPAAAEAAERPSLAVISAIGLGQILSWGSTYYLPAVLAVPIAEDTGWSLGWLFGALSVGLVASGLVSPRVGGLIHHHGGRPVLAAAAGLIALGQIGLWLAPNLPAFVAAWVVIGIGMGAGLYDPAFSTLGRLYGEAARPVITKVTLYGGLASTVCWPLTAVLSEALGWRGACLAYAVIHLVLVLPLYLGVIPKEAATARSTAGATAMHPPGHLRPDQRFAFNLIAVVFTLAFAVMTVIAVHLLTLLQARGLELAAAVALGTLIGPAQVGGRLVEMAFGGRAHPIWTLLVSSALVALGTVLLLLAPGWAAGAIILYGIGSGLRSIVRGTVPLVLFGKEGYAILMGRLAVPTLLATAAAPMLGVWALEAFGAEGTLVALSVASVVNLLLVLPLLPVAMRPR
ncbi:MFS transporter [Neoroseomonas soli]|uniref:MFS transporter n=1 Tax=Neoroseomonas soli TaxID=1081025 RepID=A0A9X9WSB2_9PROT|nr:MFS transporter [Neoroseomonas soli]